MLRGKPRGGAAAREGGRRRSFASQLWYSQSVIGEVNGPRDRNLSFPVSSVPVSVSEEQIGGRMILCGLAGRGKGSGGRGSRSSPVRRGDKWQAVGVGRRSEFQNDDRRDKQCFS
ncbi:hypothetical protein M9H77_34188 [Catharanthus roseus]|uniref:Uncharacterized protein n=1 Tax=Catharanthus roseus TaxID=4058 RepID=A0ACB9ZKS7_CATRO|nr:hypothetical protein M9H77_34188 [Catharanthus roseus]